MLISVVQAGVEDGIGSGSSDKSVKDLLCEV